ncbi:hypothetical protein Bealeia1_01725 [Candidatus Bealeia paramacronuclearis]|uniref:Alginate lyase domain-containing protein n=1 Tax=Candidatus Bealeia paramacronuclearis TaxID=1921001 RepID=A0ABZ2C4W7_9PROT|nr:hypothetical protein [Candidatus Bealeia paramacronuclearis]
MITFKKISTVILILFLFFSFDVFATLPAVYFVHQQTGQENSCPYVSCLNLKKIRENRFQNQGTLNMTSEESFPKWKSCAELYFGLSIADQVYVETLKTSKFFQNWHSLIRKEGIHDSQVFTYWRLPLKMCSILPLGSAQYRGFFPTLFQDRKIAHLPPVQRRHPIFIKKEIHYLYNQGTKKLKISHLQEDTSKYKKSDGPFGSSQTYLSTTLPYQDQESPFHEVGLYKLVLFTLGLHRDHRPFEEKDLEFKASQDFRNAIKAKKDHPWAGLEGQDLLEFHLSNLFLTNESLKKRTESLIDFYFTPWKIYNQLSGFYDPSGKPLSNKHLPGDEQMLAYYLSLTLKYLWAATLSEDALSAVMREDKMGSRDSNWYRRLQDWGLAPNHRNFLKAAMNSNSFMGLHFGKVSMTHPHPESFMTLWKDIRNALPKNLPLELIAFASHACVLSFDESLQKEQFKNHVYPDAAKHLGFIVFDSLYDKEFKPIYRLQGKDSDKMFEER